MFDNLQMILWLHNSLSYRSLSAANSTYYKTFMFKNKRKMKICDQFVKNVRVLCARRRD